MVKIRTRQISSLFLTSILYETKVMLLRWYSRGISHKFDSRSVRVRAYADTECNGYFDTIQIIVPIILPFFFFEIGFCGFLSCMCTNWDNVCINFYTWESVTTSPKIPHLLIYCSRLIGVMNMRLLQFLIEKFLYK